MSESSAETNKPALIPVQIMQFEILRNPGQQDIMGGAIAIVALDKTGRLWKTLDIGVYNSWVPIMGPMMPNPQTTA